MAKKYLLYIHEDLFDSEEHKSELVNNLLRDWYSGVIKNPHKANRSPVHVLKTVADVKEVVGENLCPHGSKYGVCISTGCLTAYRMGVR